MLVACSNSAGSIGSTASAVATVPPRSGCAAIPDFTDAVAPNLAAHFGDVGFPTGAVAIVSPAPEANGFQYRLVRTCVTGNTADAVGSFYTTNLASQGWMTTPTLPASGDLSTPCTTPPHCWIKNDGTVRYLGLEDVATFGPVNTFTLRLVIQPLSSGGALLNSGDTYDFDPTGPGSGTDDVTWTGTKLALASDTGVHNIGSGGLGSLSYGDVSGFSYTTSPLTSSTLAAGDTFTVRTADHHFAKVRVVSHTGTTLNIEEICYPYTF
jgi:hypothetical protein